MLLNKFKYIGTDFIVQSYLKNDFANICEVNGLNFRIDFKNKTIETSGKESKEWKLKSESIIIFDIKNIIDGLFDFKYCQLQIEGQLKCDFQCDHCKIYYNPIS